MKKKKELLLEKLVKLLNPQDKQIFVEVFLSFDKNELFQFLEDLHNSYNEGASVNE